MRSINRSDEENSRQLKFAYFSLCLYVYPNVLVPFILFNLEEFGGQKVLQLLLQICRNFHISKYMYLFCIYIWFIFWHLKSLATLVANANVHLGNYMCIVFIRHLSSILWIFFAKLSNSCCIYAHDLLANPTPRIALSVRPSVRW